MDFISKYPERAEKIREEYEFVSTTDPESLPLLPRRLHDKALNHLQEIRGRGQDRILPVSELFPPAAALEDCGPVICKMIEIGTNPGGCDLLYQEYGWENRYHHWTELFDFEKWILGLY